MIRLCILLESFVILKWRPTEIMMDSSLFCSSLLGWLGFDLLVCLAVIISVTKEGVKFSTGGDIGNANIVCRQNTSVDKVNCGISQNTQYSAWMKFLD